MHALDDELRYLLLLVRDWLQFAEKKNAVLVPVALTAAFALRSVAGAEGVSLPVSLYAYSGMVCFGCAALVSMISFIPQVKLFHLEEKEPVLAPSLLFFEHIAREEPGKYLQDLAGAVGHSGSFLPIQRDYAVQLVANARIARNKFAAFELAAWLAIAAVATPLVGFGWLWRKRRVRLKEVD